MIGVVLRKTAALALFVIASGCAGHFASDRAAVEYNRSFANARNEVLLLNILRAWAHEPMQFSTVSQVSGGVRTGTEISFPFANILEGAPAAELGPQLKFSTRNPNVTVLPLETREFVQGITRPVSGPTIDNLVAQGWPREVVLGLTISGVQCSFGPNEEVRINYTPVGPWAAAFRNTFVRSQSFNADVQPVATLRLGPAEALKALREGAGPGRRVRVATTQTRSAANVPVQGMVALQQQPDPPQATSTTEELDVEILDDEAVALMGLNFAEVCGQAPNARNSWPLVTRSVQSMIRYLAEVHRSNYAWRPCGGPTPAAIDAARPGGAATLPFRFRILSTCPGESAPVDAAIATTFHGQTFYVPRASVADPQDQTLQVFSILSELLALQVTEQTIAGSRPLIAIGQ